jgi:ubiquinone/menaquinone biosynthesis C-methylase UbiE
MNTRERDATHYSGPPDYRAVGRHEVFPQTTHDEIERFNFLAQMNRHLATRVLPGVKNAFELRVVPQAQEQRLNFSTRHDVRKALLKDPYYQTWSALRRMTMEQRQQAGRWVAVRQAEELAAKVDALIDPKSFALDPSVQVPKYVSAVDHHCMPGSYHSELFPGDVSAAANYDSGIFVTTGGQMGRYSDGGGHAVVRWMQRNVADFEPRRILDIGVTLGHSILPIAVAYPGAQVTAVDVSKPVLRYAAARARSLGISNIRFVQADGADLKGLPDQSFDWILTTMFLHELSYPSMQAIMRETHRLLKLGGIVLHVEQPQYSPDMPLFEQAMRDWDAFYNNEPFWSTMHEIDLDALMIEAGFRRPDLIHGAVTAVVDRAIFPDAAEDSGEDYGRKAAWHLIGARKTI